MGETGRHKQCEKTDVDVMKKSAWPGDCAGSSSARDTAERPTVEVFPLHEPEIQHALVFETQRAFAAVRNLVRNPVRNVERNTVHNPGCSSTQTERNHQSCK